MLTDVHFINLHLYEHPLCNLCLSCTILIIAKTTDRNTRKPSIPNATCHYFNGLSWTWKLHNKFKQKLGSKKEVDPPNKTAEFDRDDHCGANDDTNHTEEAQ